MPGAQGMAAGGPEPPPTTTNLEGQPKVHRARKTMSKPGNGQVRIREKTCARLEGAGVCGGGEIGIITVNPLWIFFYSLASGLF